MIAEFTLSEPQAAMAVAAVFVSLVSYHFLIGRYIRQQAGVKETARTEIAGQPLRVRAEVEFVPVPTFKAFEQYVHDREHKILGDIHALGLQMEDRRMVVDAQNDSLREKLDTKFTEAIHASNTSASKTHSRIDQLASQIGVLTGEMKHVAQAARDAAAAAQGAAVAAATATQGGKK